MIRIDGYPMDLALSEEIVFPGEVTKYPAEVGVDFSDHIRDLPPEIILECIVSDTPIGDVANDETRTNLLFDPITGDNLLLDGRQGTLPTPLPSADALARLREMKARRRPVVVETSIGTFDSMACEEITVHVDASKSPGIGLQPGALFFTAKFVKFVQVTNRRTKVRVRTTMPTGAKGKTVASATVNVTSRIALWKQGSPPGSTNITNIVRVQVIYDKPAGVNDTGAFQLGNANPGHPYINYLTWPDQDPITGSERERLVEDMLRDLRTGRANFADGWGAREVDSVGNVRKAGPTNLPAGVSKERLQIPKNSVTGGAQDLVDAASAFGEASKSFGDQSAF